MVTTQRNPYRPLSTEARAWEAGVSAALTAVQECGEMGGEWLTQIVMDAEDSLGLGPDEDEWPDCPGHEPGPFDPMGITIYCDGSCQRQ